MTDTFETKGRTESAGSVSGVKGAPSLSALAEQALADAEGDWDRASLLLRYELNDDGPILEAALDRVARELVRHEASRTRRQIRQQSRSGESGESKGRNLVGLQAMAHRTWFDWPLPGGRKLGEAIRPELMEAARHWYGQAEANRRNGAFAERVARLLMDDSTPVSEQVTEFQVEYIAQEAAE